MGRILTMTADVEKYWYIPDLAILFRSCDNTGKNKAYRIASFFLLSGTQRGSTLSPCEQKLVAVPTRLSSTFSKYILEKLKYFSAIDNWLKILF